MSDPSSIPEGFEPLRIGGEFMRLNGPIYAKSGCWWASASSRATAIR
jgi:hypothetical protein